MSKKSPLVASALALAVSSAFAQSTSEPTNQLYQIASLDPVVVSASRYEESRSIASAVVDVIGREEIEASGANNITEFLDQVSGVNVSRLSGRLGVDASVDVGYLGQAGSQNVLIMIDGQRLNQLDSAGVRFAQVPISNIERIEIRKANGGVLFGDRAQGGVINIITRQDTRKEVDISVGSFGYRKAETYIGFGNDTVFGSVSAMNAESDGYREFSSVDQESVRASIGVKSVIGQILLAARAYDEDAELPGALTKSQYDANPRQRGSYTGTSERSGSSLSIRYESPSAKTNGLIIDVFHQESKDKGYTMLRNQRTSFAPEYLWTFGAHKLLVGVEFYRAEANTDESKQVGQTGGSLYLQASKIMVGGVTADLGVRRQTIENDFQSNAGAATTSSEASKNAFSLGLRIPISESTRTRLGFLSGYRFANADELYYVNNDPVTPNPSRYLPVSINDTVKPMTSREVYAEITTRSERAEAGVHYRRISTKDEIGYNENCGTVSGFIVSCNMNLYDTNRDILSFSTAIRIVRDLRARVALDLISADIDSGSNIGNRVPLTPRQVLRLSLEKSYSNWTAIALGNIRGDMVQGSDTENARDNIPGRAVFDLGVQGGISKSLSASFWIRNLSDKTYYDYASFNGFSSGYYTADGRALEASLRYRF